MTNQYEVRMRERISRDWTNVTRDQWLVFNTRTGIPLSGTVHDFYPQALAELRRHESHSQL